MGGGGAVSKPASSLDLRRYGRGKLCQNKLPGLTECGGGAVLKPGNSLDLLKGRGGVCQNKLPGLAK